MKSVVLDGSPCRRNHSKVALIVILALLIFPTTILFNSLSLAGDDQSSKAVRRSSSEVSIKDQRRVALIIGNSDYKDMPLKNPVHDAEDIARVLRELGFTVQTKINVNQKEMEDAVREFVREIQNGDVGLFYFSGHGVQVSGENYLIPVAGSIETETDCRYKAVNAGLILGKMEESRNRTNIFILDACRNNPFRGFRSMSKGLTMMDAPVGTFIAYATAPGSVAADGTDRNSPYAKHLIQAIQKKDLGIERVFKEVLREVRKETDGKQVPWIASSLQDDFYFNPSSPIPQQVASVPAPTPPKPVLAPSSEFRERAERLEILSHTRIDNSAWEQLIRIYEDPEAVKWFRQAAEEGDAVAQYCLGEMFSSGRGVPQDRREAVQWTRKSAEQGYAMAQTALGWKYHGGNGVPKDYTEAVKWYRKAADKGEPMGQFYLGNMYKAGNGLEKDLLEAAKWYRKAAEQDYAPAQHELGNMFFYGNGVPRDYRESAKWSKKAAEQGTIIDSDAPIHLGYMYKNGYGVPKDRAEAIKWYKKAAAQGNEAAKKELQKMGVAVK